MKVAKIALLGVAFATSMAAAQTPPVDSGNPANKMPSPTSTSATDINFVKQLAIGGMAEVDAGKLASQRAQSKEVKEFAKQMVDDHSKANGKLTSLAKAQSIELPSKPDPEHAAEKAKLEKQDGVRFDSDYMAAQVKDHQKTVQLLQHQINSGQNPAVRQFATETLPVVAHHLEMAKELQAKVAADHGRADANVKTDTSSTR
jgi:putative membrane protein